VGLTFLVANSFSGGLTFWRANCKEVHVFIISGVAHQKADWSSIHQKICQLLIPLRTSMPFYNSEEERQHGLQQLLKRQVGTVGLQL
jgi:hypothetical protein